MISALVNVQKTAGRMDDIIAGKGNGLIILLHGSPGTGKTLTAERFVNEALLISMWRSSNLVFNEVLRKLQKSLCTESHVVTSALIPRTLRST